MKLWTVVAVILIVDLIAVGILLLLRRHGPDDGWFRDSQQAAGAFTVTGTIFAVLVGFVFLLAFGSYSSARSSASDEALAALSLYHVTERFPDAGREELQSDVACYGRAVVADEWPAMADRETSDLVDHWETRMDVDSTPSPRRGSCSRTPRRTGSRNRTRFARHVSSASPKPRASSPDRSGSCCSSSASR